MTTRNVPAGLHSQRNAAAGGMRTTRAEGTNAATSATAINAPPTAAKTSGSLGFTS